MYSLNNKEIQRLVAVSHPISREMYSSSTFQLCNWKLFPTPFRGRCTALLRPGRCDLRCFPPHFEGDVQHPYRGVKIKYRCFPPHFEGDVQQPKGNTMKKFSCFPPHFEGDVQQQHWALQQLKAVSHPISREMYSRLSVTAYGICGYR